jgi:hypothetical protein
MLCGRRKAPLSCVITAVAAGDHLGHAMVKNGDAGQRSVNLIFN